MVIMEFTVHLGLPCLLFLICFFRTLIWSIRLFLLFKSVASRTKKEDRLWEVLVLWWGGRVVATDPALPVQKMRFNFMGWGGLCDCDYYPCSSWRSCSGLVDIVFSPAGPPELFEAWLLHFSLEEKKGEISELLGKSPSIRSLYSKMVSLAPWVLPSFLQANTERFVAWRYLWHYMFL